MFDGGVPGGRNTHLHQSKFSFLLNFQSSFQVPQKQLTRVGLNSVRVRSSLKNPGGRCVCLE